MLSALFFGFAALRSLASAQAQTFAPAPVPVRGLAAAAGPAANVNAPGSRFYGAVEYLYWWVKAAPLSVPLISSGPSENKEGFLINSGSTVLYGAPFAPAVGGKDTQSFPGASGTRLTLGYFLDDSRINAVETSAFALQRVTAGFSAAGNANGVYTAGRVVDGQPAGIRIPVYNTIPYAPGGGCDPENGLCLVPKTEDGVPVSLPGDITGKATARNSLQLWGMDISGVRLLASGPSWAVSGLAGAQYLDLEEGFGLTDTLAGIPGGGYVGQSGQSNDSFKTRNQFYGVGLGLRGRYTYGPFFAEATGRLGIGVSHEVLSVQGSYFDVNSGFASSSGPYGTFAMPANEGRFSRNNFAAVPAVQVKLGYNVTPAIRLTVGYDFLYDNNVIRPGDQINRNVPKGQTFQQDGTAASTTSPTRLFRTTDFFAHGLSAGVSFTV